MQRRRARRAFTIVELLVALMLMGVTGAGLVTTLTADRRLRDLAAAQQFAADRARERLEYLAALACVSASAGASVSAAGSERWHATPSQSTWRLTDSLFLRALAAPLVIEAHVACPE